MCLALWFPNSFDMARGSSSCRGRGGTSRRPRTQLGFHLVDATENSTRTYRSITPLEIQSKMDLAKADVHFLSRFIPDDEVTKTTNLWVPDTGIVQGRSSQYLKTVDILFGSYNYRRIDSLTMDLAFLSWWRSPGSGDSFFSLHSCRSFPHHPAASFIHTAPSSPLSFVSLHYPATFTCP